MLMPADDAQPGPDGKIKPTRVRQGKGVYCEGASPFTPSRYISALSAMSWLFVVRASCKSSQAGTSANAGGCRYEGDFALDAMEGFGRFDFPSGAYYKGSPLLQSYDDQVCVEAPRCQ
jgi:hypothetical protein